MKSEVIEDTSDTLTIKTQSSYGQYEVDPVTSEDSPLSKLSAKDSLLGIVVEDDPANNVYPLATEATGHDEVFVGRIRRDESVENGINFWCVADNIRKGAASNAVQIAELLIAKMQ